MNDGDQFCPGCGAPQGQQVQPAQPAAAPAQAKKKKISGGTIFFIIMMLLIVGAGLYIRNAKNGFSYKTLSINDTTYALTYSGSLKKGKMDGKGVLTAESTEVNYKYDGEFSGNDFKSGTMTVEFMQPGDVSKVVYEGDFTDFDLDGSGTRTITYTKASYDKNGVRSEELVSDFRNGIPSGDSELTANFSKDYAAQNGADCCVFSGNYKNGKLVEPYEVTYYNDGEIVMKGTKEGGVFKADDAYKSTAERFFDEFVDEYGLDIEFVELIGEGLVNLFR
jgi:hypothetical protein